MTRPRAQASIPSFARAWVRGFPGLSKRTAGLKSLGGTPTKSDIAQSGLSILKHLFSYSGHSKTNIATCQGAICKVFSPATKSNLVYTWVSCLPFLTATIVLHQWPTTTLYRHTRGSAWRQRPSHAHTQPLPGFESRQAPARLRRPPCHCHDSDEVQMVLPLHCRQTTPYGQTYNSV